MQQTQIVGCIHRLQSRAIQIATEMGNALQCCGLSLAKSYDEVRAAEDANTLKGGVNAVRGGECAVELGNVQLDNNGKIIQYLDNNNLPITGQYDNNNKLNHGNNNLTSMLFGFMKKSGDEEIPPLKSMDPPVQL